MKGDIMAIDFVYEDELKLSKDNYEQQFIKIVEAALQYLKIEDDVELSCIIVDDERIIRETIASLVDWESLGIT